MIRYLIIILLAVAAYKLFFNDFKRRRRDEEKKEKMTASGELVKDPICGTYVSADGSVSVRDGDKVYRFCGYECRDSFLKQIEQGRRELTTQNTQANPANPEKPEAGDDTEQSSRL